MSQLLSLLAAIALLVWATHFVRAAVMQRDCCCWR